MLRIGPHDCKSGLPDLQRLKKTWVYTRLAALEKTWVYTRLAVFSLRTSGKPEVR
jgi:hypothetical protein